MLVALLDVTLPTESLLLPLYGSRVPAGFPSPADDYLEGRLDLLQHLVRNPAATFIARASGTSMTEVGIMDGALLVVDRSVTPKQNDVVIAVVDGAHTCKILDIKGRALRSANPSYPPIIFSEDQELTVVGVVIHVVNQLCRR